MRAHTRLWRRLDGSGHDTCRLEPYEGGWRLAGTTVFLHHGQPACLTYIVEADAAWCTRLGDVRGWAGRTPVELRIVKEPDGAWTQNGVPVAAPDAVDVDLGFTPSTNLLPLRRLGLAVGEAADAPAVWLDDETWTPARLPQRYERRSPHAYWYTSPTYAELLEVDDECFVRRYPHLWEAVG